MDEKPKGKCMECGHVFCANKKSEALILFGVKYSCGQLIKLDLENKLDKKLEGILLMEKKNV
jgi:hypothetical protein